MGSGALNNFRRVFLYAFFACLIIGGAFFISTQAHAAAGVNQQINFQGRLLNAQGATVPDGYYNIQFKIYQDGDGQTVGNTTGSPAGSLKWTESHLNVNSQGVMVKNGFMSVQLGSVTPFGSSVDWNQDTLWLSMNIASTNASCTPFASCSPDGEMVPMKRMSSTPYALNAGLVGGLSTAQLIQNTTSPQTANIAIQSTAAGSVGALIQGAGGQTADIFQVKANGVSTPLLAIGASGAVTLRNSTDSTAAFQIQNTAGASIFTADTATSNLSLLGNNSSTLSTWTATTAMSVGVDANARARVRGGAVAANGYIYQIGGVNGNGTTITTVQYAKINADGTLGSWVENTANPLPEARRQFQPVAVNGYLYLIGGRNNSSSTVSTAYYAKLNPDGSVGTWNTTTALPEGRFGAGTVAYNGYMYVVGGFNPSPTPQNTVYYAKVNPNGTLGSWSTATNMPDSVSNINGTIVANGYLYVPGGNSVASGGASNNLLYAKLNSDGTVGSWTNQGAALQGGGGDENFETYTANGYLYVLGGDNGYRVTAFPLNSNGSIGSIIDLGNSPTGTTSIGEGAMAQANGYFYLLGGSSAADGGGTVRSTVYYASTPRVKIGGGLDLVGLSGENLAEGGTGGQLTAGNATFVGTLQVQDSASFVRGVSVGDSLRVNGSAAINGSSTTAFQIQSTGNAAPLFNVDTVNNQVLISTPTFSTSANDANCYTGGALVASSCTMSSTSVNNTSAIIVGFNQTGQSASLPDPTITTAGRVVYITAANGSSDFTLLVNGGGTGNSIAMRQNTTATMIWNGTDWTAAGASSSTTLQSAYDNTLQSAGGAELIVSSTSNTNGLTIRDSSVDPVNGTLLSVQTASAATLFSINSNVTEYSSNGGAEATGGTSTTFPASTWSAVGAATVSRHATAGNFIATGQGSVSVVTPTTANTGVKNTLNTTLTANTTYNISFTARLTTGTFTDMNVYYSVDGTTASVACVPIQPINTSVWTKVNCTFTAPSAGITSSNALLIRQTSSGTARTFYVDNLSVTIAADYNYATDGTVGDNTNFATNWSFVNATSGVGSVTRNTSDGNDASDSAQVALSTGAVNAGLRNKLSIDPLQNKLYRVTTYAKLDSGTFTDFKIRYSPVGSTGSSGTYIDCVDYNTQAITTTEWTKITCYINTDGTTVTTPYINFVETTATARTFSVDTFSMTLASNSTPNVQIGGGINGGPTTLFTLDKGASAPIASDNDALLGSMYYDTTLGKLQCYEADGWGACGSSPDNVVTISPEYTNAVMHGTGVGTMTSDICSGTLNINDADNGPEICGANETYNFYKWTSPQATPQNYSIYVTYQLPSTFKSFASGQTSLMGRTDSSNSTVNYQVYRSDTSGLSLCGSAVTVSTGSQSTWQTGVASGTADPSTCGFTSSNSIVFKITITSNSNANAYVGNLNFTFSNH